MRKNLLFVLKWAGCVIVSFLIIFLFVFFGGHKLFESGNQIFIEICVAVLVGSLASFTITLCESNNKKIQELEKRIETLERKEKQP